MVLGKIHKLYVPKTTGLSPEMLLSRHKLHIEKYYQKAPWETPIMKLGIAQSTC